MMPWPQRDLQAEKSKTPEAKSFMNDEIVFRARAITKTKPFQVLDL
jgi:hypothetical protein